MMIARTLAAAVLGLLSEGRIEIVDGSWRRAFGPPAASLRASMRVRDAGF